MPAASSALSNKRPAGPTKGLPVRSSSLPGCSPTNITFTRRAPSPKTVCVPFSQRSQARQSAAALFSDESVGRGGIKSAAELSNDLDFGILVILCGISAFLCASAVSKTIEVVHRRGAEKRRVTQRTLL